MRAIHGASSLSAAVTCFALRKPLRVVKRMQAVRQGRFQHHRTAAAIEALWVSIDTDRDSFTLYSGAEKLDPYELPGYAGLSQRTEQVLLTPFAAAMGAINVGAVIGFYSAPQILAGLSR